MKFKTPEIQRRWNNTPTHAKLAALVADVENELDAMLAPEPTMTESLRTRDETIAAYGDPQAPVSPHEIIPLRAFDLRSRDDAGVEFSWLQKLVTLINKRWTYDPARPSKSCVMYHDIGKGAHLHFQVCDQTIFRGSDYEGAA